MENIGIWVGTQEGNDYRKDNTGMLCRNTEQELEQGLTLDGNIKGGYDDS